MTDSITNLLDCQKKVDSLNMKERTSFVRTIIGTISLFLNYSEKKINLFDMLWPAWYNYLVYNTCPT